MSKSASDLLGDSSLTKVTMDLCFQTLKELSDIGVTVGMSEDTFEIYIRAFSKLLVALSDEIVADIKDAFPMEEVPESDLSKYAPDDLNI